MSAIAMTQSRFESRGAFRKGPCIALVTPYTGGNLGDAAIQDSMISNLRLRMPEAEFLGITLNCENFVDRHGSAAFPLLASVAPLGGPFSKSPRRSDTASGANALCAPRLAGVKRNSPLVRGLKRIPGLVKLTKRVRIWGNDIRREVNHWVGAYRILRDQDVLLFSGGGQLDDEYGGAWRLPYAYFKWSLIARVVGVPCGMASIGAGRLRTRTSRMFAATALRLSCYRSFRETRSKRIAEGLFSGAKRDPVVPDLAFSLPESELPTPRGSIRAAACRRPVIALSPIAFGKPINWPTADRALFDRYVHEMAGVVVGLLDRGYFVAVVCSSLGDDESVIADIVHRLDSASNAHYEGKIYFPKASTWRELVAVLQEADCLIASRLHATILGFVAKVPAVAISFDPKVDWVMEDAGQSDYLLHIQDFTAGQVLETLDRLRAGRTAAVDQITAFRRAVLSGSSSADQFDLLAKMALERQQLRV